ncbi:hypothetical protein M0804_014021 [Polistes exclamans]|nr:hypothetical protein M0804_014023 [Polistes exclamans]KAI4475893.1 hypothetical protein M0804_014021 [Polistes exclamans]
MVTLAILTTVSELNVMEGPRKTRIECPTLFIYLRVFSFRNYGTTLRRKSTELRGDDNV